MKLNEFVNKYNGKKVDYDKVFSNQCKDLFSYYNRDVVGNPNYVSGDAYLLYDNAPSSHYDKAINTKTYIPPIGSIVIWNKSYGGYGHVGIVLSADINGMLVFSQNHTGNLDPCEETSYSYSQVKGFLIPKNIKDITNNEDYMKTDLFGDNKNGRIYTRIWERGLSHIPNPEELKKYFGDNPNIQWVNDVETVGFIIEDPRPFKSQIESQKKQISDLSTSITSLNSTINDLKAQISSLNTKTEQLTAELEKKSEVVIEPKKENELSTVKSVEESSSIDLLRILIRRLVNWSK